MTPGCYEVHMRFWDAAMQRLRSREFPQSESAGLAGSAVPVDQNGRPNSTLGLKGSGEQLVQVRGANGLDQVPLDPRLAREFAAGMLTVSRQGNQSHVL